MSRIVQFDRVIAEAEEFEPLMARIQASMPSTASPREIKTLRDRYLAWRQACLQLLPADLEERFEAEYARSPAL